MKSEKTKEINTEEFIDLKKIIKKYSNFYKALYLFDPAISADYKIKNEKFMKEKQLKSKKEHSHVDENHSCCSNKSVNKGN
jgi:hypothetical protein